MTASTVEGTAGESSEFSWEFHGRHIAETRSHFVGRGLTGLIGLDVAGTKNDTYSAADRRLSNMGFV